MRESYLLAYKLGCKDVTVFRDTSIQGQVLVAPRKKQEKKSEHHSPASEENSQMPKLLTVPLVGVSQAAQSRSSYARNVRPHSSTKRVATSAPNAAGAPAPKLQKRLHGNSAYFL